MTARNIIRRAAATVACVLALASCDDEVSQIGNSLIQGEADIRVDSTFRLTGASVATPVFDTRSTTNLLGTIDLPEYGRLSASYVARLMSASIFPVPDSIGINRIDSVKLTLTVNRGDITGDSVAPQQVTIYRLDRQLPDNINSAFDPVGYYDASSPIGIKSYTLSLLAAKDSVFYDSKKPINVSVKLPDEWAKEIALAYKNNPDLFAWPQNFSARYPGIYVKPSFGRGCIANVATTQVRLFYHYTGTAYKTESDGNFKPYPIEVKDSVAVFAVAPEALSSNNLTFEPSQSLKARINAGEVVMASPVGYNVRINFPLRNIIKTYKAAQGGFASVNALTMRLPAQGIENDGGLGMPPYLLMVRTNELASFFANNKLPDNKTSFWATYSSITGCYSFTGLRDYMISKLDGNVDEADEDFTLVPVMIAEEIQEYYGTAIVTSCVPYMTRPTLTIFDLNKARIALTFSTQTIK